MLKPIAMKRSITVGSPPHYPSEPVAQDESPHSACGPGIYPALSGYILLKNIFAPVGCIMLPGITSFDVLPTLCVSVPLWQKIPIPIRVNSCNSRKNPSLKKYKITKRTHFDFFDLPANKGENVANLPNHTQKRTHFRDRNPGLG
jgi:hypothetical protein